MRKVLFILSFFISAIVCGQERYSNYRTKKVPVTDTITIDTLSINPRKFKVFTNKNILIDSSLYQVNFQKSQLILSQSVSKNQDSIRLEYYRYPDFLTQKYFEFDPKLIVPNAKSIESLYSLATEKEGNTFTPFDGLSTSGSISRGVTIGSNQNSVLDSELDLQITGKISENISLRASIQDANIPIQESGFSQNLDEFDQIFIELFGKKWNIRAGDVTLENTESHFAAFTKKVQGIATKITLEGKKSNTDLFASGALVRGVFTESKFTAQEGNQGPYKLTGSNGELFILIISGSEKVYVNGLLLTRGENEDYTIDYNAGELRFNPTYPITSNMRITVQYQVSERNYSRVVAYGGGNYKSKKLQLRTFVYSENDAKNQPVQQSLGDEQKRILSEAGDDRSKMIAPSAVIDTFDENKVLYTKSVIDGQEIFVFAPEATTTTLFNVRFTQVGLGQGDYILINANAINRIFEYVAPIDGIKQGNFAPIIQLESPEKLQVAMLKGAYTPSQKTAITFELAGSKSDQNLFSDLDDNDNDGFAGQLNIERQLIKKDSSWALDAIGTIDYIQQRYRSPQRIYNIEFERDWNLETPLGDQYYTTAGLVFSHPRKGMTRYEFQHLNYSKNYNGNRHQLRSTWNVDDLGLQFQSSTLQSSSSTQSTSFFRLQSGITYSFSKNWIGAKLWLEDNQQTDKITQQLNLNSQRFSAHEIYTGVGDSTKVFIELGYQHRINDSVQVARLQKVSTSNTYFLKSKLLNTKTSQLSLFVNYRNLNNEEASRDDEQTLNSRILYNQQFFNRKVLWNTLYETNSGTLPQQEFSYVQVDPGEGNYTWNDYNGNNIQELEEFEIAQFQDQAIYLRVLLPNQIFLRTHQNKLSQTLTINLKPWAVTKNKMKRFFSHFYNQTSYLINRKIRRDIGSFELNPFANSDAELALNLNFRNTIFYNRGKQRYTTSYTYLSAQNTAFLITGLQETIKLDHQFNFQHKFGESWLIDLQGALNSTESIAQNFINRNFLVEGYQGEPKLSYLLSDHTRFSLFYLYNTQENVLGNLESLAQQKIGASFSYANKQKISLNCEFNAFVNDFEGNAFSPVGYQLLNGLQPGTNYTWSLLTQKKITKYLDLNLTYQGRKSETSSTIHTGSVQLRAYF